MPDCMADANGSYGACKTFITTVFGVNMRMVSFIMFCCLHGVCVCFAIVTMLFASCSK